MKMMPGIPKELRSAEIDERELAKVEAIICSMTIDERRDPTVINGSRRLRIAQGSGTTTRDVNGLLKQFKTMRQMMKSIGKGKRPQLPVGGMGGF
jgi:signal recognition particle subunit SRP54